VLAATLEYVVLPGDLGAQVITRSSYGRLGLITATAIQIHPLFRGCLTLELVNLGALPISLYPGERVAQLVLSVATPPLIGTLEPKYDCATRPEFSRVRKDRDAGILRHLGDL
jgi:deoxycytidine triphosphate deaminase